GDPGRGCLGSPLRSGERRSEAAWTSPASYPRLARGRYPVAPMAATANDAPKPARPSTLKSLELVFTSWRTASVTLQSFFSGMPLGLIWVAMPAWMARSGVNIKTIGLLTLAQTPWTFKFLWSPLMDRYTPPFFG